MITKSVVITYDVMIRSLQYFFNCGHLFNTGQVLKENKVLSSLELQHCELDQDHLCKVCNSVEANTTLTSLSLSGNKFNDHSVASLGK